MDPKWLIRPDRVHMTVVEYTPNEKSDVEVAFFISQTKIRWW